MEEIEKSELEADIEKEIKLKKKVKHFFSLDNLMMLLEQKDGSQIVCKLQI